MRTQEPSSKPSLLDAIEEAVRATQVRPTHPGVWLQLADAYEQAHQLEQALSAARTAVRLAPNLAIGHILLGKISVRLNDPKSVKTLKQTLQRGISQPLQVEVHTLIAEYFRKNHQHHKAYQNYLAANRIRADMPSVRSLREGLGAHHPDALYGVETWAQLLTTQKCKDWPPSPPPCPDMPQDPIFLIGFPRSGTTLLARMLGQHPNMQVLEEEAASEIAMQALRPQPDAMLNLNQCTVSELITARSTYWSAVRHFLHKPLAPHIRLVDKMPLNILRLPVLARLFPNSQFILALRDPRDACLSCFMQNFRPTPAMATFVDPEATARYHRACFHILQTTESHLSISIVPVRYEELVTTPRSVLQQTLTALQFPWSNAVLNHNHESQQRPIHTPSYKQVAAPLYQHAVGRWQHYLDAIHVMLPWLEDNLKRYNYSKEDLVTDK